MATKLKHDFLNAGYSLFLRCIAYFILQPMLILFKGEIKPKTIVKLRTCLPLLSETAKAADKVFKDIKADCAACNGKCCQGGFNRLTVFDHISDVIRETGHYHRWGYWLTPINSYKANIAKTDESCVYLTDHGCTLPYPERPIMICVMDYCGTIGKLMTKNQKLLLTDLRRKFNKVFFTYTIYLLWGGITFKKGIISNQNLFVDNRKLRSKK